MAKIQTPPPRFLQLKVIDDPFLNKLLTFQRRFQWAQVLRKFVMLSNALMEVYHALEPAARIERNHKIWMKMLVQRRCQLADLNMQRKVCIIHNRDQINYKMKKSRGDSFTRHLSILCAPKPSNAERRNEATCLGGRVLTDLDMDDEEDDWDDYVVLLLPRLLNIGTLQAIPDTFIHG